jgi:predicted transcriptional regulator
MQLKEYLYKYGIKHSFIAEKVGITKQCIARYIMGYNRPPLEVMAKIEDITNGKVSIRDWLKTDESKDNTTKNKKTP